MSAVSSASVAQSIEAVNAILVQASEKNIAMSKKLMAVSVEMALTCEAGKGGAVDTVA